MLLMQKRLLIRVCKWTLWRWKKLCKSWNEYFNHRVAQRVCTELLRGRADIAVSLMQVDGGFLDWYLANIVWILCWYCRDTSGMPLLYISHTSLILSAYCRHTLLILFPYSFHTESIRKWYGNHTAGIRKWYIFFVVDMLQNLAKPVTLFHKVFPSWVK